MKSILSSQVRMSMEAGGLDFNARRGATGAVFTNLAADQSAACRVQVIVGRMPALEPERECFSRPVNNDRIGYWAYAFASGEALRNEQANLGFVMDSSPITGLHVPRNISGGTGVCTSRSERFRFGISHRVVPQPQDFMELRGMAATWNSGCGVVERKGSE
jgi:hypothetical protein